MCSCYTEHLATYSKVPSSKKAVIFHRDIFVHFASYIPQTNLAHLLERAELTAMVKVAIDWRVSSEVFPK